MFIHYRTKGVVLEKRDKGETGQSLTIFTEDFGKIEVLAKASRKIASKLRPAIEPGYYIEIEFIEGKMRKTLTDAVALQKYPNIRNSFAKLRVMFLITGVVADMTGMQENDKQCFKKLKKSLEDLNQFSAKNEDSLVIFYFYFLWNFIKDAGYLPELYSCALCGKRAQKERLFFSLSQGGIICRSCFPKTGRGSTIPIEIDALKALRFFIEKDWGSAKKLRMDGISLRNLRKISAYYLKSVKAGDFHKF